MGSHIGDPADQTNSELADLLTRVHALETAVQAIEPRMTVPVLQGFETGFPSYWRYTTSSAAFVTGWKSWVPRLTHPGLLVRGAFQCIVGVTGEARVVVTTPTTSATSTVLPITSGYSSVDALGWQHGLPLWEDGGDVTIELQIRMTGGADVVRVSQCTIGMIDPRGCTTGGGTWTIGGWLPNW